MSKSGSNSGVKIVKSCTETLVNFSSIPTQVDQEQPACDSNSPISHKNFLENVDENILFEDDSIVIKKKPASPPEFEEAEKTQQEEIESPDRQKANPHCFEIVPTPLTSQIPLPFKDVEPLCFYEVLMLSRQIPQAMSGSRLIPKHDEIDEEGSACVMAEEDPDGNLCAYMALQISRDFTQTSYDVISVVDKSLKLIHEKMVEKSYVDDNLTEKSLQIIAGSNDSFRIKKSWTMNNVVEHLKSDIEWTRPGQLLSYAGNVLMTRRLVIDRFEGCIQSWSLDIDGEFFLSHQVFNAPESMIVFDQPAEVQQVNQILTSESGKVTKKSTFLLASTGNILKEICSDEPSIYHLNPFSKLPLKKCVKNLQHNWESDIQLMSMYLDFKAKRKNELMKWTENPRTKNILCDYIKSLVKSKPKSVMNFTVDFMRKLERDGIVHQTASRRHQQI